MKHLIALWGRIMNWNDDQYDRLVLKERENSVPSRGRRTRSEDLRNATYRVVGF